MEDLLFLKVGGRAVTVQCSGAVADLLRIPLEKIPRPSIRAVPFFVVDRLYGMSGAQPAE